LSKFVTTKTNVFLVKIHTKSI